MIFRSPPQFGQCSRSISDNDTLLAILMTITLLGVTFQARRLGNEKRDVALLGTISGLSGAGAVATWVL